MTALRASLFTRRGLRFRSGNNASVEHEDTSEWARLVSKPDYLAQDCKASECLLLTRDIWHLRDRQARIMIAPRSRCAYDPETYNYIRNVVPFDQTESTHKELIDWNWVGGPAQVLCMPAPEEWTTKPYQVGAPS
jgi:hypothetical protein